MKLLVICPGLASHYRPLSAIATAANERGADVVVATGTSMAACVAADGFRSRRLGMSERNDVAVLQSVDDSADATDARLVAATRKGMVPTLAYQADARADDLLWRPVEVATALARIVDDEQPDAIVVDHLSVAASLGLRAGGHRFTTFVAGHPSQLPVGDEIYGAPTAWPAWAAPSRLALDRLRRRCRAVSTACTEIANDTLQALAPGCAPLHDAFAAHGADVLYNAPRCLHDEGRQSLLPPAHRFLGSCARVERLDEATAAWLAAGDGEPFVYVSLGTILSARADVVRRIVDTLSGLRMRGAIATGATPPTALGALAPGWLTAPTLPQAALLPYARAVVTHGANSTVTEALAAGCPLVVLPFSSDQFATAADVERAGVGVSLDPNRARPRDLAPAIADACDDAAREAVAPLAAALQLVPGPDVAASRLVADDRTRSPSATMG